MAWDYGFTLMQAGLGVNLETAILFLICIGSLIFFAKDFKIGVIMLFTLSGLCFMMFYFFGVNYRPAMVIFLMSLVIMAISFYAVSKSTAAGGLN